MCHRGVNGVPIKFGRGDVSGDGESLRTEVLCNGLQAVAIPANKSYSRTNLHQCTHLGATEAGAGPRHDCDFVTETIHVDPVPLSAAGAPTYSLTPGMNHRGRLHQYPRVRPGLPKECFDAGARRGAYRCAQRSSAREKLGDQPRALQARLGPTSPPLL